MEWMEHEERLFRLMERSIVRERLREGFEEDVEPLSASPLAFRTGVNQG